MRIGIVNDMRAACEALRRVVDSLPDHTLAWTAVDGVEAIAMAKRDRPDLILMDLIMPHVNGVQATRQIMASAPCAILEQRRTVHVGHLTEARVQRPYFQISLSQKGVNDHAELLAPVADHHNRHRISRRPYGGQFKDL